MAARAYGISGQWPRSEIMFKRALEELDPERDRERYGTLLGRLARVQRALNRTPESLETGERALAMLPSGGRERALLLAWLGRTRLLRGRFKDAIAESDAALAAAKEAGDPIAESEVLNTLGMAQLVVGDVDQGVLSLRRAIDIAREHDDADSMITAYGNLADTLKLAGRTVDALAVAREGLELAPQRITRSHDWMTMTLSDVAYQAGDWKLARATLGPSPERLSGVSLLFRQLREAEQSLGEGDEEVGTRVPGAHRRADPADLGVPVDRPAWRGAGRAAPSPARLRRRAPGDRAGA